MASALLKPVRNWNHGRLDIPSIKAADMTVVKVKNAYNVIFLQAPATLQSVEYFYNTKGFSERSFQSIPFKASSCTRLTDSRVAFACDRHIVYMRPHPARLVVWATTDTAKSYSALRSIDQDKMWAAYIVDKKDRSKWSFDIIDFNGKVLKTIDQQMDTFIKKDLYMAYSPLSQELVVADSSDVSDSHCLVTIDKHGDGTRGYISPKKKNKFQTSSVAITQKGTIFFVDPENCCIRYTTGVTAVPEIVLSSDNCPDLTTPKLVHVYDDMLFVIYETDRGDKIFMFHLKDLKLK